MKDLIRSLNSQVGFDLKGQIFEAYYNLQNLSFGIIYFFPYERY